MSKIGIWVWFRESIPPIYIPGAYPEIFRSMRFEIFLYGRENLGGVLGFFYSKTLANWKNFPKRVGVLTSKTPPWIRPCYILHYLNPSAILSAANNF